MRPNFALSLSFSGIQLLQRQENGWGRVGDVDISSADLKAELAALHDKASALGSGPVETKLIIPDDQIKYLTVDASGLDKAALQSAVLGALDGATPYPVDELEFDFANEAGKVYVAAVAKETLQEAEAFANEHGFAPMGFVAAPAPDKFPQEASFGVSDLAKSKGISLLETDGTRAIATGEAVAVIKSPPATDAKPDKNVAPEPVQENQSQVSEETAEAGETSKATAPDVTDAPPAPVAGFSSRRSAPEATPAPAAPLNGSRSAPDQSAPPRLEGALRGEQAPLNSAPSNLSAIAPSTEELGPTPQVTGVSQVALEETEVEAKLSALRPGVAADDAQELDGFPPVPPTFAAAPRPLQGAADGAPIADLRAPLASPETSAPLPNRGRGKTASRAAALAGLTGSAALTGLRGLMSKRAKPAVAAAVPPVEADPVESAREDEKQRMTVFGARKPKKKKEPIPVGGKPRFLGLILTAILLLFLISVAAWASVFLDDGLARFFGGAERNRAIAELPLDTVDNEEQEDIQLASLETGEDDILLDAPELDQDGLAQVQPTPVTVITPEEAAAKYAATGIWLATPQQPISPEQIPLEDVYTASIDAAIVGQDAFALEPLSQPRDLVPDGFNAAAPVDPQSDTTEELIAATPEGVVTPEGALVFLGRPARVPPELPERLKTARLAPSDVEAQAEAEVEVAPTITASLRPKARPETLVEDTERSQLGGNSRAELAKIRPKLRPKLEKEVAEVEAAETPATKYAVAASRKPSSRPNNFARIVSRAQEQAEKREQATTTQVAAAAPRAVKPSIPSKASVAKTATVRNAINLSRVNLIGVYGKPSSRRALVRLSSGRYKKVKVGDRVDGGRVSAIGESQLIYTKSGRNVTLRMPKG